MDQGSVSTEPGLEIGPVNFGKLLNCNEFMKYVVQIVNKERRSLKKIIIIIIIITRALWITTVLYFVKIFGWLLDMKVIRNSECHRLFLILRH